MRCQPSIPLCFITTSLGALTAELSSSASVVSSIGVISSERLNRRRETGKGVESASWSTRRERGLDLNEDATYLLLLEGKIEELMRRTKGRGVCVKRKCSVSSSVRKRRIDDESMRRTKTTTHLLSNRELLIHSFLRNSKVGDVEEAYKSSKGERRK